MKKKSLKEDIKEAPPINIWGWSDPDSLALDVYNGIHSRLLEGYLVFAYQGNGELRQFVITQKQQDGFMLGVMTTGYTMFYPFVPKDYVASSFMSDLKKKWKIEEDVIYNLSRIL